MRNRLTMTICIPYILAQVAFAQNWAAWTPAQRAQVVRWVQTQTTRDAVTLRDTLLHKPVSGHNTWTEDVPRDRWQVIAESRAKQIAHQAGITAADTVADLRVADTKLTNWIATASAAAKPLRTYYAAQFWACLFAAKAIDGSESDTTTVTHHDPIYGLSLLETWGIENRCTAYDVKAALRAAGE